MRKKLLPTVAFIAVLLFSTIVFTQLVRPIAANPCPFSLTFAGNPIITINLPLGNETYSYMVPLKFTITKDGPWVTNWTVSGRTFKNKLANVSIIIDGQLYKKFSVYDDLSSPYRYSKNLTNLKAGTHTLRIIVYCDGWDIETHNFWQRPIPYNASSGLATFTVGSVSPDVTVIEPTSTALVASASLASVAVISIGLLVYLKKRKRGST